ncbi:gpW family head-tail joining protein [Hahella sp. KA22]|uniref:gpW family head-tail joining protein n=1 Tax=Hahella sp. KA22 TaxID=1628392 RepID=UPI00351A070D
MGIIRTEGYLMATQADLDAARAALNKLLTGQSVVQVQHDNYSATYKPADAAKLRAYIAGLESQLGLTTRSRRGPAGVTG